MRVTTLLALLFFLAAASQAATAMNIIRFGKLIDVIPGLIHQTSTNRIGLATIGGTTTSSG